MKHLINGGIPVVISNSVSIILCNCNGERGGGKMRGISGQTISKTCYGNTVHVDNTCMQHSQKHPGLGVGGGGVN